MKKFKIAIVGCSGMVGRKFLEVLQERNLPISGAVMFASAKSAGQTVEFLGKTHKIVELNKLNIKKHPVDIALFSAGGSVSKEFAPIFANNGTYVIDNSSQWRMDDAVPLVIPEVNGDDVVLDKKIIANPNCSTIQAIVALKPLHDAFDIKRIVYSTYQAVSGAGVAGHEDLANGISGLAPKKFSHPIFNNLIPQIDVFLENGYTKEEEKMIKETRKILHAPKMRVTATTVRVPVYNSHSESINVEFNREFTIDQAREILSNAKGVVLMDNIAENVYPTPLFANGKDDVFVGRLRRDFSVENGMNFWVVADNIRKGAATNAVQIAELLMQKLSTKV